MMRTNSYTSPGSHLLTRSGRVRAYVYGRWPELLFAFENDRNIRDTKRLHVYQRSYVLEYMLGQMTVRLLCPNILPSVLRHNVSGKASLVWDPAGIEGDKSAPCF